MEGIFLKDIISAIKGKSNFENDYNPSVREIQKDSRLVDKESIYIALVGENLDGHDFAQMALSNGAIAVISEKEIDCENLIIVEDTYKALKDLAMFYLSRFDIKRIGVTGSSGKTTTKDMLYYALSNSKNTHRNIGNLNSEVGLPLTVLDLNKDHECGIFEMGMYALGEIDYLAEIVKPQVAIITNVGLVHLEKLETQDNIFTAKMEIANYMEQGNTLIVNGDDKFLSKVKSDNKVYNVCTYGFAQDCDYKILNYQKVGLGIEVEADFKGVKRNFFVPALGEHNVMNAISVLAACQELGLDFEKSKEGLKQFVPSKLRMDIRVINGKVLINDAYNANPDSMKGTLPILSEIAEGRRVSIIGDMRELGECSKEEHKKLGALVVENADVLVCVGKEVKYTLESAKELGMKEDSIFIFETSDIAAQSINSILKTGDTVFVKGSRGIALEKVIENIL